MCVFFFKQKTAYEMRISDWSSDVCSSDLASVTAYAKRAAQPGGTGYISAVRCIFVATKCPIPGYPHQSAIRWHERQCRRAVQRPAVQGTRSEERRVGKAGVSTCRSRWAA